MSQFKLTTLAASDYRAILKESRRQFGQFQRDRYKAILDAAIREVAENPERPRSRQRDEIAPGVRTYHIAKRGQRASHFLVYRILPDGVVEITRILHERMASSRHIPETGDSDTM